MRIGVIGAAGTIGKMRIKSIQDNPATSLAAVMDLNKDVAAAAGGGVPAHDQLDAFLDTGMDAVVISTPPAFHEDAAVAAFARGYHVLCEKPLSNTVEGGRRIVEAGIKAERSLGTGFNMRYYPAFAYVRDVIDQGRIGEIDHVRVFGRHDGLANFRAEWQYKAPASGGGALWDVGIHMTDMARFVMGDITDVYGVSSERVWQIPGSEDNALVILKNAAGVPAMVHASWNAWTGYESAIEVYGTHGMVRGAYAPMRNLLITQERPGGPRKVEKKMYRDIMVLEKLKSWTDTALKSFAAELVDFIKQCEGQTGLRNADGHAGLAAIEIAAAVPDSTASGAPVTLRGTGRADLGANAA